jgi:hypothetical protein
MYRPQRLTPAPCRPIGDYSSRGVRSRGVKRGRRGETGTQLVLGMKRGGMKRGRGDETRTQLVLFLVRQVGPGGTVDVVRPSSSAFTLEQYQTSLLPPNSVSRLPGVEVRTLDQSVLPTLRYGN